MTCGAICYWNAQLHRDVVVRTLGRGDGNAGDVAMSRLHVAMLVTTTFDTPLNSRCDLSCCFTISFVLLCF